MARRVINTFWDRKTRNDINDNFKELYDDVGNIAGSITDDIYEEIRQDVKLNWKNPVDTLSDLPADAETGDTRMVRESVDGVSPIYRYNGSDWIEIQEINATAITEVESRLQSEIDKKETPAGSQEKVDTLDSKVSGKIDTLESTLNELKDEAVTVVESGTNDEGHYIRWSDGKQECWGMSVSQTTTVSAGNIFRSEVGKVTFPKPFSGAYPIYASASASGIGRWANVTNIVTTDANVYQFSTISSQGNYAAFVYAIGRWK